VRPTARVIRLPLVLLVVVLGSAWDALPARATFPGRNGLIAFDTGDGPHSQIYVVGPRGGRVRQLTHGRGGQRTDPRWSADGARIAYVSDESGTPQIWVMRRNGSHQRRFTRDAGGDYFAPSWSPDGKRIVASRCSHLFGTCDIVVLTAGGKRLRTLVGGYWHNGQPAYAPDGRRIAYTSDHGGYDSRMWIADAQGRHRHHITAPGLVADRPNWSPNGRRLTFTGNPVSAEIFSVAVFGGRVRRLRPSESLFATYSPNGRRLVFAATAPGCDCRALFTARANGRHARTLPGTRLPGVTRADWSVAR
jgi:Tol biopolymer transport system component